MLHHLNRRGLNKITRALLTVYNLQCIIRFPLTLMLSSVKTMASSRFGNNRNYSAIFTILQITSYALGV